MHDSETRQYVLYVPATYDGSESYPVMFNFTVMVTLLKGISTM